MTKTCVIICAWLGNISRNRKKTAMSTSRCTLILLLIAVHGSIQKSTPASPTYKAAVVELKPVEYIGDPAKTLNVNAGKCANFIGQAANKDADIVVFPELALPSVRFELRPNTDPWTTLIPDPSENYEPCTNSSIHVSEALKTIACAAEKYSIYVVINLVEKEVCAEKDNCPSDGVFYFVSNVVFDRTGRIISRARKVHLFDEFGILDVPEKPEYSTFDTDFGVTFGNVICLDIMYEEPALTLTRKLNITDIVYTSGWFSIMPFLTTIQMEAGWAYAEDVNLLAGGYNRVNFAYSGSGIYAGRQGILNAIIRLDHHEEVLVSEVMKKSNKSITTATIQHPYEHHFRLAGEDQKHEIYDEVNRGHGSQNFSWKYDDLEIFETKIIATNGSMVQTVHHMGIECEFRVNITNLKSPITYRLLALDGIRRTESIALGTRVCVIVQCANETLDSCGHIRNTSASLNYIAITARYIDNGRTLMMPNTLGADMLPLQNWAFHENKDKRYTNTSMYLTTPTQNLVTFGLWGRNFEADVVYASAMRDL